MQVFGEVLALAAFPPWLLRFSEIYHAQQLATFTPWQAAPDPVEVL